MKKISLILAPFLIVGCGSSPPIGTPGLGDGANYTPVIDGPKNDLYYKDLQECRQLAYQVQQQQEAEVAESALIGALLGAAIGSDNSDSARDGALIGGVLGGADAISEAYDSGKTVISNCLRNRGHNILL